MGSFVEDDCEGCPMCGGQGMPFGTMGTREHFRCRQCGMTYSVEVVNLSAGICGGCGFAFDDSGKCRCHVSCSHSAFN